ncbi:MAG: phosphoglycerate mutase [Deltaproteobacteria bacterium]|nr:phosphoglycerate mutase [Deltaproteobacteria bacterium]
MAVGDVVVVVCSLTGALRTSGERMFGRRGAQQSRDMPMPSPSSRTWFLVRHGETEWNAIARMQGQLDSPLTALGREHARTSGRLLARLGVDTVFASPLGRVRETLAILSEHVTVTPVFDDRLMEWSAGAWSGELYSDLPCRWPDEWAAWTADRYNQRSPRGENFVDLAVRGRSFVEAANRAPGERVAIVAHGFFNCALAEVLLGLSSVETMQIRQANDVVIRIVVTDGVASADHFVGDAGPVTGLPA